MSKITNDSLTWSDTAHFVAVAMWQQWAYSTRLVSDVPNTTNLAVRLSTHCIQHTRAPDCILAQSRSVVVQGGTHRPVS